MPPEQRQSGEHRQNAADNGQKLIKRHNDSEVIILWLTAAPHTLLLQPIAEAANHACAQAVDVGEHGGEEKREQHVENNGRNQPAPRIPDQTDKNRNSQEWDKGERTEENLCAEF